MIPNRTKESIDLYVERGVMLGSFVMAVLENNLKEAFGRADEGNIAEMFHIVSYCYNNIPVNCWGSPEKVARWLKGMERLTKSVY